MTNLNMGCGNYPIKEDIWLNLDKKGLYQKWEDTPNKDYIEEFDMEVFPWKFRDNNVENILFSHSLNQVKHHKEIFKECHRILKPKGRLIIKDDDNFDKESKYYTPHPHTQTEMYPFSIFVDLINMGFKRTIDKTKLPDNHPNLREGIDRFTIEVQKWVK